MSVCISRRTDQDKLYQQKTRETWKMKNFENKKNSCLQFSCPYPSNERLFLHQNRPSKLHQLPYDQRVILQDLRQVYQNRLDRCLTVFCIDPNDLALLFITLEPSDLSFSSFSVYFQRQVSWISSSVFQNNNKISQLPRLVCSLPALDLDFGIWNLEIGIYVLVKSHQMRFDI